MQPCKQGHLNTNLTQMLYNKIIYASIYFLYNLENSKTLQPKFEKKEKE